MISDNVLKAIQFATVKHSGQFRKHSKSPYIVHPLEVLRQLLIQFPEATEEEQIAAILHDTVEDTDTTHHEIEMWFGLEIADLVIELTDTSSAFKDKGVSRLERKKMDFDRMLPNSRKAKNVKCSDIFCNCNDFYREDKKYAIKYINEKLDFLPCLEGAEPHLLEWVKREITILLNDLVSNQVA